METSAPAPTTTRPDGQLTLTPLLLESSPVELETTVRPGTAAAAGRAPISSRHRTATTPRTAAAQRRSDPLTGVPGAILTCMGIPLNVGNRPFRAIRTPCSAAIMHERRGAMNP